MAGDKAYRKAEKKIEAARRSGETVLDLSAKYDATDNEKLTELPESLGQLTQLQSLNLSGNQLTALPEFLKQLTQLQPLDLSHNQLKAPPESLRQLTQLRKLDLSHNKLTTLPEWLGNLTQLQWLSLSVNQLAELPEWLAKLTKLNVLDLSGNKLLALPESLGNLTNLVFLNFGANELRTLPDSLGQLRNLKYLYFGLRFFGGNQISEIPLWVHGLLLLDTLWADECNLSSIPEWLGELTKLKDLRIRTNNVSDLPISLAQLEHLEGLHLDYNPLNPELATAYKQGLDAVKAYLRAKATAQIILNEAKLILVGEGEVGKTCLMDALLGKEWKEHPSTHGIEIQQVKVTDPDTKTEITLNGWDFGGQRVYRPTHQLFFSAPAVYLVVWKPREGPQQGFVKEWIQLIKRREPSAKILVVATHGGPQQRQPDIDRQELWDLFGKDTVIDFFHIESKPDQNGNRKGIEDLKLAIARVAANLPEVGRLVPKSFQDVRQTLQKKNVPYLPLNEVHTICRDNKMDDEITNLFITISHSLGHLTHYRNDPALRDIVILRPDWLSTAMSYILDDEETRKAHGLVKFSRLSQLWSDTSRPAGTQYTAELHKIFLRLMERFDLSYRVADPSPKGKFDPQSLIAQLVPDIRPDPILDWLNYPKDGNIEQTQICRIFDDKGRSANAEGLFYQLIVRLQKYSLGREDYYKSVHWQRGLVLDDDYNGRALLEHKGNDVHITVRAPYPERFLAMLTEEVKYLVESFWEGLRCDVMVPCIEPCGRNAPGTGLYEVEKLIDSKRKSRPEFPCPVCNEWQSIDSLLRNAPAARPISLDELLVEFAKIKGSLDEVNFNTRRILSQVDKTYTDLLQVLTDEAKEGPRLFSFTPVDRSNFNPKEWTRAKFRLTLWCEHSRKPLPILNGPDNNKGVYEIELTREWFKKTAPYLKLLTGTLSLVLPVASSATKLALNDTAYKSIEEQLDFGKSVVEASIGEGTKVGEFMGKTDKTTLEHGEAIHAQSATLRELQALLKAKDPGFGGLVRVMNKRKEFLWVHPQFEKEY